MSNLTIYYPHDICTYEYKCREIIIKQIKTIESVVKYGCRWLCNNANESLEKFRFKSYSEYFSNISFDTVIYDYLFPCIPNTFWIFIIFYNIFYIQLRAMVQVIFFPISLQRQREHYALRSYYNHNRPFCDIDKIYKYVNLLFSCYKIETSNISKFLGPE